MAFEEFMKRLLFFQNSLYAKFLARNLRDQWERYMKTISLMLALVTMTLFITSANDWVRRPAVAAPGVGARPGVGVGAPGAGVRRGAGVGAPGAGATVRGPAGVGR